MGAGEQKGAMALNYEDLRRPRYDDPLLHTLPETSSLANVREALLTEGFCVLKSVLTSDECGKAVNGIWDFVEDVSSGTVQRSDPITWYPSSSDSDSSSMDSWPCTDNNTDDGGSQTSSSTEMFQSWGAGFVLGPHVREALAERVFEPLYQTRLLHCSKEGFAFHRPTAAVDDKQTCGPPESWVQHILHLDTSIEPPYSEQQKRRRGLLQHSIQSLVALEDQKEGLDGCFMCFPKSHGAVTQALANKPPGSSTSSNQCDAWFPLQKEELDRMETEFGIYPKYIFASKGDVILWRSDLIHALLPPAGLTPRFCSVAYTSMQPSSLTPDSVIPDKMNAYKQRQTGDHRTNVERWYLPSCRNNQLHRPHYRTSPPAVSIRLAELYGILPYTNTKEEQQKAIQRAVIRGVRFTSDEHPLIQPRVWPCPAKLEHIHADANSHMVGQDKYLGGMASPCGTYIFGVPGTARRVLRINTETNIMDWIGDSFEGKFKWLRGVEIPASVMQHPSYPVGCCLALASNSSGILKINPATDDVYIFGEKVLKHAGESGWYYHGGNLAENGFVYAIPANADRVAKIDPRTDEVTFIGPSFPGKQKWFGGIVGEDRKIYGIPHNHVGVLQIDPESDKVTVLFNDDGSPLPTGNWKWHGGLAAGPKIYGFPNNSDTVLVVDTRQSRIYTIGDANILQSGRHRIPQDGRYKYLGGALTLCERYAYLFPCDAERVLRIDTQTDELKLVGAELLDGENKYQNGFVARDGCLYGIPQRSTGILRVIPPGLEGVGDEEHVDIMYLGDDMVGTKDKFEGGVMGGDGNMYCIPLRAKTCVKVIPGPAISK